MRATAISLLIAAAICLAQSRPEFRSSVNLVTIPCTVFDSEGKLVTGLTREDFHVFDNERRRLVDQFWVDTDQPLTLGVIVDASDSQQDLVAEHRDTALALLEQTLRPGDRAFVIYVNEDVRLWAGLTGDFAEIRRSLNSNPGPLLGTPCPRRASSIPGAGGLSTCGGTPLWNAIYETARSKLAPLSGGKALAVLTDGFDTGSTHTWREAADEVARAETSVYAIQYQSNLGGRYARDLLALLEESGGAWFGAPAGKYDPIVSRIEADLRNRYVLGFKPDTVDLRPRHEIRIELPRPDLRVRARKAYIR